MELSRRNFLMGAGAMAGAAAVAGLTGCSPSNTNGSEGSSSENDWLGEPPAVSVEDCVETIETDVLVVGSAQAGMHAAYSAIQEGADVIMIERNGAPHISGAQIGYVNSEWLIERGQTEYDPQYLMRLLISETQHRVDADLAAAYIYNIGAIADETIENVLEPAGFLDWAEVGTIGLAERDPVDFEQYLNMGMNMCTVGGDSLENMVMTFHDWIRDHGGTITFNTCARKLVQEDDGTVIGVIATNENGEYVYYKTNKGVVMCTGPYQGNEDMVDRFCYSGQAEFAKNYCSYNARASETCPVTTDEAMDDGLGMRMMCWAGGEMENINPSYQCGTGGPTFFLGRTLEVDCTAQRFHDEGYSGMGEGYWAFGLPDGSNQVWQIVCKDDFPWPARYTCEPQDPETVWTRAMNLDEWYQADTIEDLANQIGLDPDILQQTVDRYNEICDQGYDDDFGKQSKHIDPAGIKTPPYYAFPKRYQLCCLISGVRVNRYLQVIDENRMPIPNLYAAGNCIGGRQGSGYTDVFIGLTNGMAVAHGYLAGQHCARGDGRPA